MENTNDMEVQVTNRIDQAFDTGRNILSIYYTAGFPTLEDTLRIARDLQDAGADMIEIGIPFSDPVADGPTIQESSQQALENGMSLSALFEQLADLRSSITIPVLLMGYFNPVLQYGVERFAEDCQKAGIDGLIIPDLPLYEYEAYEAIFRSRELHMIHLISPGTSDKRIKAIEECASGFTYIVSSNSITGAKGGFGDDQIQYFERIQELGMSLPKLIGFGISNSDTFTSSCQFADGAIIGSAFVKQLQKDASREAIIEFIHTIRKK